jgi:glyoxylase-like metal-dependent hydrolase (beta-lactamase superfamily II)
MLGIAAADNRVRYSRPLGPCRRSFLLPQPEPSSRVYGRGNYQEEFEKEFNGPEVFAKQFFGERFSSEDVLSYKPEITIDNRTDLNIGGSRVELIPVQGSERDAMLVYLPDEKVMFMGDVIAPYLGAPFVSEGDLQGLFHAIDVIVSRILSTSCAARTAHAGLLITTDPQPPESGSEWLRDQVLTAIRRGDERATIQRQISCRRISWPINLMRISLSISCASM